MLWIIHCVNISQSISATNHWYNCNHSNDCKELYSWHTCCNIGMQPIYVLAVLACLLHRQELAQYLQGCKFYAKLKVAPLSHVKIVLFLAVEKEPIIITERGSIKIAF